MMNPKIKLILALDQVENLTKLLEGNEYQSFLYQHLISIQVELTRQLTNIKSHSIIKE
jgi:predicted RNA-binding protein with EMAP domain